MNRLVGLGAAGFAVTTSLVLLGAVSQEAAQARHEAATASPAAVEVADAVTLSLLTPAAPADPTESPGDPAAGPQRVALLDLDLPPAPDPRPWAPPAWFPEEAQEELWALDGVGTAAESADEVGPRLRLHSKAVFVYDVDSGEVLLARNADDRRPVASLTKVVAGLALASEAPDMDAEHCLDSSFRPGWPGARTKLRTGSCATGWDLLGAALVRSDNGAAYALADVSGLAPGLFVDRMNAVAQDLGMTQSTFAGPSGVEDDNLSTARDMTRALLAASRHPDVQPAASAPFWDLHDTGRDRSRRLLTTNRLHDRGRTDVLAAKTGYTDTARHCFSGVFRTRDGRQVAVTTLGARWSRQRWSDVRSLLRWVEQGG